MVVAGGPAALLFAVSTVFVAVSSPADAPAEITGAEETIESVREFDVGLGLDDDPSAPPGGVGMLPDGTTRPGDVDLVVATARAQLGKPYVYGATGPSAFDCSGLIVWSYAAAGIALPRTTYQQVRVGVEVPLSSARRGDLLFSRGDVPVQDYGHVGMYLGDGTMIVAPKTGDVVSVRPVDATRVQAVRRIVS